MNEFLSIIYELILSDSPYHFLFVSYFLFYL